MGWYLLGVVLVLLVLDLLVHIVSALIVIPIFERKIPFSVEASQPNPDAERISFPTTDGLTLRGSLLQHPNQSAHGLIIFCPELEGSHWLALSYCEALWESGFDILSFDFRNQGESDHLPGYDPLHWLSDYEVDDAMAAISYVKQRADLKQLPLGLVGISRGGGAALAAGAMCPDVQRIACEGSFSTEGLLLHFTLRWASLYVPAWILKPVPVWHLRLTLALARLVSQRRRKCHYTNLKSLLPRLANRSVLLIAGKRDTYVHPSITEMLGSRIGGDHVEFWKVKGAKHNMARQVLPEEYDRRLVDLFTPMALPSPASQVEQPSV